MLEAGQWKICYRADGTFAQQIQAQLPNEDALKTLITRVNGSGVKVAGKCLSVEVRSCHPHAGNAGNDAGNLIVHAGEGGQCL